MHKTRLEGDHQTLTFGVMQLVDMEQPQDPTGQCKKEKKARFQVR